MGRNDPLKVCLAASAGGHLNQLLKLESAWEGYDRFFVTTNRMLADELTRRHGPRAYAVGESNHRHPFKVLRTLLRCTWIVLKERPDVVVSTGAAHGCVTCLLCKLGGGKMVWIDSIANVERLSLSGRIVRRVADLFIVQWGEIARRYPRLEYHGQLV